VPERAEVRGRQLREHLGEGEAARADAAARRCVWGSNTQSASARTRVVCSRSRRLPGGRRSGRWRRLR
jgi:hypothetical protein